MNRTFEKYVSVRNFKHEMKTVISVAKAVLLYLNPIPQCDFIIETMWPVED